MKKCKRCNGTGKVFKATKGTGGVTRFRGIKIADWRTPSVDGETCPRCGGRGEV